MKERYKDALCLVCRESAILEQLYLHIKKGETVDENELVYHLELLVAAKESFLKIKEELGYTDGLSFMDDASFCGFSYRNGCLTGDYSKLPAVLLPFIEKESDDAHFKYEVGVLLFTHYFMQRGEYEYSLDRLMKKLPFWVRVKMFFKKKAKEILFFIADMYKEVLYE